MKVDGDTGRTPKSRREEARSPRKSREKSREKYDDDGEEGYARAARLKNIKERTRSMGFRNTFFEALKQQQQQQDEESLWEETPQKSKRNNTTDRQRKEQPQVNKLY